MMAGFGFSYSYGNRRRASGPSGPVSLYAIADFTPQGPADHVAVLGPASFRYARTGSGEGRFDLTGVPSGNYRISGILSAWDGAALGALSTQFRVQDQFTQRYVLNTAGAFTTPSFAVTSGTLTFRASATGIGGRIDEFFIEAV